MDPNLSLNGDEARILMAALRTSNVSAPMSTVLNLYMTLAALSQVQPPPNVPQGQGTSNEGI